MIIRAYVRHLVGECESVFICGILIGAIFAIMLQHAHSDLIRG